jgi:hypothetical protein
MKIASFEDIEAEGFDINFVHSGDIHDADVVILDINTIFDYEEKKHDLCKENWTSIAVIEDPDDYDAFKNFGIDGWIKKDELPKLPSMLEDVKKRMGL